MTKTTFSALLSVLATVACGKSDDKASQKPESSPEGKKVERKADPKKVEALREAWKSTADCQLLVACCAHVATDDKWKSTYAGACKNLEKLQDFEEQVLGMLDASGQAMACKNIATSFGQMGNSANPVPAACKRS